MTQPHEGPVTMRELYALIQTTRSEILLDLRTKFAEHERDHDRDAARRNGQIRWAVTTVLAIGSLLVAIYVAVKTGG